MKVIHVITRLDKGGSAEDTLVTATGLNKDRYEVVLIKGLAEESEMSPEEARAVMRGLKTAEDNGVRIIDLPCLVRRISPIDDLKALLKLFKIFRREKPHIVHTHTSKAGLLGRWAAFLAGVPFIIHTPHGHVFHGYFNFVLTKCFIVAEKISVLITDKIVTVTDRERDEHFKVGVGRRKKFITIHSGVALDCFIGGNADIKKTKKEVGIPQDYNVVGTVGRLVTIKGHRYLIEAAQGVIEQFPRTVFVFVGDGDLKGELGKQARALGISKNILFIGWRNDVAELLSTFDIFAFPSLNEGMGKVLIEAMAVWKPIVASKVGGIIDLVIDGVNGILVPPKDSEALCKAILRLLTDKSLARQLGKHGREMIYPDFDVSTMIQKIEEMYGGLAIED